MISRAEFDDLQSRVSHIETVLHISELAPPPPSLPVPITFVIEEQLYAENITDHRRINARQFYKYLETDYHIFMRIYIHGKENAPLTSSKLGQGFREFYFVHNYYNVLIIKHRDLGVHAHHIWAKMNTKKTVNVHMFAEKYERVSFFIGYSNDNKPLVENDNLFVEGKSNGIFFVINDKTNKNVANYVEKNKSHIETLVSGLAGDIDVYKSKELTDKLVKLKVISTKSTPQPEKSAPRISEDDIGHW